jgi:acetyltransferase
MLRAVFEPGRVALVGASARQGSVGDVLWRNLSGFPGEVVPVTASVPEIDGHATYPSLAEVPGQVDLAVVAVPASAVPQVIRDAGAKGVPAAIVITGGFAEAGEEGARLQEELMTAAREGSVRIVGPNCLGVQNCDLPLNASISSGIAGGGGGGAGGISLVTQSGAYGMAVHSLGVDERLRFAKMFAAGNKADFTEAELVRYLGADPASRTLCFFLESLRDGRDFFEAASRVTHDKPVIVAKTGRSAAGRRAAWSHTAALAGSERVWRAAFEQAGVVSVRSGLEMIDVARVLDGQPLPDGGRIGIITNSGGTGVELSDLLADEGLTVPELSAELRDKTGALLPAFASSVNPVDMTPVWQQYTDLYPALIELLARSGEVDTVVAVLLQRAANEQVASAVRDAVARLRSDRVDVPVCVCWIAPRSARAGADLLAEAGVPCLEWPERTARAIGHATRYAAARIRVDPPPAPNRPLALPSLSDGNLPVDKAEQLLNAAGIRTVPGKIVAHVADARRAAADFGYPCVAKVVHDTLVHKSDAGGVRLGLRDAEQITAAVTDLLALAPGARVLVQPQCAGIEMVIGGIRDPQFGPSVLAGLGGVFVEAIDDVAVGIAPLSQIQAARLLAGLRGHAILTGFRGAPPVDLDALSGLLSAVGDLMVAMPEVTEIDLNPVLAAPEGCLAVDWRVRIDKPARVGREGELDSPSHGGEFGLAGP